MNNAFEKDVKQIQKLVNNAQKKTGNLMALNDGGAMPDKKLQQTLEQTMGYFESATLELRKLCERHTPGIGVFGAKPLAKQELPTGSIEIAGCGWVHMQINTLLPHCRYQSPEWLSDTIRYLLVKYMMETEFHLRFKKLMVVIDEHSNIHDRHVFDQDNKGWKAVSNALKGLVIDDDDQYHMSIILMSEVSSENVCHITLMPPESAPQFFSMHMSDRAYLPLEPSVEVDMKTAYPFIERVRKTDGSNVWKMLSFQGFPAR